MRFILTLLLLFVVLPGLWAQDIPIEQESGTETVFQGFGIHLMPFSIATRYPRLRLGMQYKLERFSLVLDAEYGNDGIRNVILQPDKNDDYRFVGIRPEIRYSLPKLVRELYVGMELPYTRTSQQFSGGYYSEELGPVSVSSARRQRNRFSIIPKIGAQFLEGRFTVDAYMGAGLALVEWTYLDREDLRSVPVGFFNENFAFFNEDRDEGRRSALELSGGFRFGFWLSR
ncbi:hypothetical protein [Neolewinella agarilytica]|nr:hypothetical protein [Neolewinella agarilytica]